MPVPRGEEQPQRASVGVYQCVNLGVGAALVMLVDFGTDRIDAPSRPLAEVLMLPKSSSLRPCRYHCFQRVKVVVCEAKMLRARQVQPSLPDGRAMSGEWSPPPRADVPMVVETGDFVRRILVATESIFKPGDR